MNGLLERSIEIWLLQTEANVDPNYLTKLELLLSEQEKALLKSIPKNPQKNEFLFSKSLLRTGLSHFLKRPPQSHEFTTNDSGRPFLKVVQGHPNIYFSVSHTLGLVACAFFYLPTIGLDVEDKNREVDILTIASEVFSAKEIDQLKSQDLGHQKDFFFKIWTAKEAYLKAQGTGIINEVKSISLNIDSKNFVELESGISDSTQSNCWRFTLSNPTLRHQLAVAFLAPSEDQIKIEEKHIQLDDLC